MRSQFSNVQWGKVLLAGVVASVVSVGLVILVIGAYAMSLAAQARGSPDQARIGQFADQVGIWVSPVLAALLAFFAAVWVARRVETAAKLHGLLVGLVVAISGLIFGLVFGGIPLEVHSLSPL